MTQADVVAWSIAMFSSRETVPLLLKSVAACRNACSGRVAIIDVMMNGNANVAKELSHELQSLPESDETVTVRVWFIAMGDKAHAWNTYVHEIWSGGEIAFFVDGYVEVYPDAFQKMDLALNTHPRANAATGIDLHGWSADRMASSQIANCGIHGNCYAMRREAMWQTRDSGFRLPMGIYRTDPTLESCLKYDFDPATKDWEPNRIFVVADAHWSRPVLSPWKRSNWFVHWRRVMRQAQGDLEQIALKTFWIYDKKKPGELPTTAIELIENWVARFPSRWRWMVLANPLRLLALRRLRRQQDWSLAAVPPTLITAAVRASPIPLRENDPP